MKEDLATITVQIPEATRRRLRILAAETGLPIRVLITRQIDNLLATAQIKPPPGPTAERNVL